VYTGNPGPAPVAAAAPAIVPAPAIAALHAVARRERPSWVSQVLRGPHDTE
jgi:hypothetical protein